MLIPNAEKAVVDIRKHRSATLRSAWIIEHGSEIPKLTTCYPL
ncbi:MAG: DUF6883 domain-containing protein [Elainellaceae cyanobacterium]